jgi:ATP-dependent RNA helicase RhlE
MHFQDLRLSEPILRAVSAEGYHTPTPIQLKAVPHVLEGRDLLGCAQTGTGKTAAFALPILHRLSASPIPAGTRRVIRALVLSPTRELASQIADSFRTYGRHCPLRHAVIFGGVGQNPQTKALRGGLDILVATPGRLLDLMNQGHVDLRGVEYLVLDEADRMLDMGFIHDIRRIVAKVPARRQTLMFSATMPQDIRQLAEALLTRPVHVEVTPVASTVEKVEQSVYFVVKRHKPALLRHLLETTSVTRCLVFTRTKHGADRVVKQLAHAGVRAEAIHGNKSQNNRQRALGNFRSGKTPVLVATDIAARGIDVDGVSHVINYDVPNEPETYVHRIGRTGRAGASGIAVSFCDHEERGYLHDIQRLIRKPLKVNEDHPIYPALEALPVADHTAPGRMAAAGTQARPLRGPRPAWRGRPRRTRTARGNRSF